MAKKLENFDWQAARKRSGGGGGGGRTSQYPWNEWLNGEIWELVGGEDFTGNVDGMRSAVQSKLDQVPNVADDEVPEIWASFNMPDPKDKKVGTVTLQSFRHKKNSEKGIQLITRRKNADEQAKKRKAIKEKADADAAKAAPKGDGPKAAAPSFGKNK